MRLIEYAYNDTTQLTTHFRVSEWKCKCGKNHKIVIADTLPLLLEKVMIKIGATRGDISSGYRCAEYDKKIGGTGGTTHQGYACDIKFTDKNGNIIDSKQVALALEDLGHQFGIGYKCGGSSNYTHIDVKPRKWYGDESKSMTKSCCDSFYDYFGIPNPVKKAITYQVYDNVKKYWLPNVKANTNDYAGNFKNSISGVYIDELEYRVYDNKKNSWLPWVKGRQNFAGNIGNPIGGIQIKNATYRVHLVNGDWLDWVSKVDDTNEGYAGIKNKNIDAIQVSIK